MRSAVNSMYNCHNPKEIKRIKQLLLGLSYLKGHNFKHNFQEFLNLLCNCRHGIESSTCFFSTVNYSKKKDALSLSL